MHGCCRNGHVQLYISILVFCLMFAIDLRLIICMSLKEGAGWRWTRPPPASRKSSGGGPSEATQKRKQLSTNQRLLKGSITSVVPFFCPNIYRVFIRVLCIRKPCVYIGTWHERAWDVVLQNRRTSHRSPFRSLRGPPRLVSLNFSRS